MKVRDFSKLYIGLLILHLAVIYKPDSPVLYYFSKPLLLFSLTAFFLHRSANWKQPAKLWIAAGLAAAWASDFFAMTATGSFHAVLIAITICHFAYSGFYFCKKMRPYYGVTLPLAALLAIGVFVIYRSDVLPAQSGFFGYGYAIIAGLHIVKGVQFGLHRGGVPALAAAGAVLFTASNVLFLYSHFALSGKYLQMALVAVYAAGHYLIAIGILAYGEEKNSNS